MFVYLLDGLSADGELVYRSRAAAVAPSLEQRDFFEGVPYALNQSRFALGGIYIVIARKLRGAATAQSEAWGLFRSLRAISQSGSIRERLERLSERVAAQALYHRQHADRWSLMLVQWATSLPPDDGYLQGRVTLGDRLLEEIVPDLRQGTTVDRRQAQSILVRIFGSLGEISPAARFGIGAERPLVNLAGDEDLLEELDLRARSRKEGMEAMVRILEGEARLLVMTLCMLPICSGVMLIDIAFASAQALTAFLVSIREAGMAEDEQDEWDLGVTLNGIQVFIPALRHLPVIGRAAAASEALLFGVAVLSLLINVLSQFVDGLARMSAAIEAGFDSYGETDAEEFFEIPLAPVEGEPE